ncbi:hypothetical protein G7Y79_00007g022060 [Physcia stellaris]|nr:hypothetical protein G7Y79_00007g022060 [Physcia stellaris]
MDLVAGVRKEGSRGGRGDFKWEDVKGDQHRENYLGHSLMARTSFALLQPCESLHQLPPFTSPHKPSHRAQPLNPTPPPPSAQTTNSPPPIPQLTNSPTAVGRWQRNRDLSWYANSNSNANSSPTTAQDARTEELRRIKEAEQDALSAALGFPVAPKVGDANAVPVAEREREIKRVVEEAGEGRDGEEEGRGVGFGGFVVGEGAWRGEGAG